MGNGIHDQGWWEDGQVHEIYQLSSLQATSFLSLSVQVTFLHFLLLSVSSELSLAGPCLP